MSKWHTLAPALITAAGIVVFTPGCFLAHGAPAPAGRSPEAGTRQAADADVGSADASAMTDAAGDAGAMCAPRPVDLAPTVPQLRLVWEAPGGVVGRGPAIVVTGDGQVRMWADTLSFVPTTEPDAAPDATLMVPPVDVPTLYADLLATNMSALPHAGNSGECEASLWFRNGPSEEPAMLHYSGATQVSPELDCVWQWFDYELGSAFAAENPRGYCRFP